MIAGGEFHLLSGQNVTPAAGTRPTAPEPQYLVWLLAEGGGRGRLAGAGCRGRSPLRPVMARTTIRRLA